MTMWLIFLTKSLCLGVRIPIVASMVVLIRLRNFCRSSSLSSLTYAFSRSLVRLGYRHRSQKLIKKLDDLILSISLKFLMMLWAIFFLLGSSGLSLNFLAKAAFFNSEFFGVRGGKCLTPKPQNPGTESCYK